MKTCVYFKTAKGLEERVLTRNDESAELIPRYSIGSLITIQKEWFVLKSIRADFHWKLGDILKAILEPAVPN